MAVMDFREGGYVFGRHKVQREFSYDQHGWDQNGQGQQDQLYADAPAGADGLSVRIGRLTHYFGALVSVGLMVGLLAWGWQLVSRDVSGVPVIRALEGDSRTTPEDPGGELSSYTGFAVNNVAEGNESQPVQQVAIAPAAVGLSDEDVAMGQFGAEAHEPATQSETPLTFAGEPINPLSDREARAQAEAMAAAEAQRLALAQTAVENAAIIDAPAEEGPVNEIVTDENGAPADGDAIAEALMQAQAATDPSVIVSSPRPSPRPRVMRVASAKTVATDARPVKPAVEAPKAAPAVSKASGPQVQLGAFDSNAIATKEWNRLSGKFGGLFSGKGQVIQQHESNGRTFWRLRVAGFDSIGDARSFCASLKSGGTDCLALSQ